LIEPFSNGSETVAGIVPPPLQTADQTVRATVSSTVDKLSIDISGADCEHQESTAHENSGLDKKELIRQAMSELGKRSAASRTRRKETQ